MIIDLVTEIRSDTNNWSPSGLTTVGAGGTGKWSVLGQWITVSWLFPANAETPLKFEVCVYLEGGTPESGPYLINPIQVEPDKRTYKAPVSAIGFLPANITAVTKNATATITTSANHNFSVGDKVYFTSVGGMTELSTNYGTPTNSATITSKTNTTFTINVDTTAYTTYTSGGIATPLQKYKGAVRALYP